MMCMFLQVYAFHEFLIVALFFLCCVLMASFSLHVCIERARHRFCAALKAGEAPKGMIHMVTGRWSQEFSISLPLLHIVFF